MILLVNPNLMKPPVTPVALDYLGQALEKAGFRVSLLDLAFEPDISAAIQSAVTGEEQLIAVTVRNTDDCYYASQDFCLDRTREIIRELKALSFAPVIVGGVGYSVFPREALDFLEADAGVVGEGEDALCRMAARVVSGEGLGGIPGVVLREDRASEATVAPVLDLAGMDLSARPVVDNARYLREGAMVGFETKRGCDHHCIYCADPIAKGSRIRLRDPDNVAQEIRNLLRRGVDTFHTCDSEFNVPPDHGLEVCRSLIRLGLGDRIRWYAYATPLPFPEELAEAMRRAGCVGIDFGVDHADDEMLSRLGRRHRLEHLRETAARCRRHGLVTMYDLLLGGPGETRASLMRAFQALKSMEIDRVGAAFGVRIYPGTSLARLVVQSGFRPDNPHLRGQIDGNEGFLRPVYYVSAELGEDIDSFVQEQIGGDERFFLGGTEPSDRNYNYNDNSFLIKAIRAGERGAFWDILRRSAGKPA